MTAAGHTSVDFTAGDRALAATHIYAHHLPIFTVWSEDRGGVSIGVDELTDPAEAIRFADEFAKAAAEFAEATRALYADVPA